MDIPSDETSLVYLKSMNEVIELEMVWSQNKKKK